MDKAVSTYRRKAGLLILVCLAGYAVFSLLWQNIRVYSGLPEKDPRHDSRGENPAA